jgi:hypothetical protein
MSRALLAGWQVHAFASGLYPERGDLRDDRFDRLLGRLNGRWAQRRAPLRRQRGRPFAAQVEAQADVLAGLDDGELGRRATAVRLTLASAGLAEAPVVEFFAFVREVARGAGHAPLRRAAAGRARCCRASPGRDGNRRGQDADRHAAGLRGALAGIAGACRHGQRLPGAARCRGWMGPVYAFFGLRWAPSCMA